MHALQSKDKELITKLFDCVNELRKALDWASAWFNVDNRSAVYSYTQNAIEQASRCLNEGRNDYGIESCVGSLATAGL